jgi:hypothetical protein
MTWVFAMRRVPSTQYLVFHRVRCSKAGDRPRVALLCFVRWWDAICWAALALAAVPGVLSAQQIDGGAGAIPLVTFTLDFPQSNPEHYSIAVQANGHARYECTGTIAEDSEAQPYRVEFEVSAASRDRIFGLAKQAQYFAGKFDSGNRKLAFTGTKLLTYHDGQRSNTAHYNYSNLEPVRELTDIFQKMAGTLEYGRRLAYYHRYQKLALDEELKHMEKQARNNELNEMQSVAPVLREIVEDAAVINVVRARAQALIEVGKGAGAGH